MSDLAAWDRLVDLLTDDPRVAPEVRLALTDADAYLERHAEQLADRGIDEAGDVEPVLALDDALEAAGELAFADWQEDPEVLLELVTDLPRVRTAGVDLDTVAREGGVEEVLAAINRLLAPVGVVIAYINEGNDSYPLVAVPVDRMTAIEVAGANVDLSVEAFA